MDSRQRCDLSIIVLPCSGFYFLPYQQGLAICSQRRKEVYSTWCLEGQNHRSNRRKEVVLLCMISDQIHLRCRLTLFQFQPLFQFQGLLMTITVSGMKPAAGNRAQASGRTFNSKRGELSTWASSLTLFPTYSRSLICIFSGSGDILWGKYSKLHCQAG